ncbi:MAG: Asp-tRNA(Asn)/Glu-tRNA(Gln) amidotransferase subunit GatB [Desulfohalobiaceae bacterium]|nr:Asp-tRNA(Asn)/Glu-tRNA(Gln) amidotransferase subunit GatB [Desulfohalobiaceae bacterium]
MSRFEPVIGLEVHAQLKTRSKLFCSCPTDFGKRPNANTCPVCAGMPGALPVVNRKAVEYAVKLALAVQCSINRQSVFARKNYFYPDLPKGYQISQYEEPLAENGRLNIISGESDNSIGITRIHMEDDAGKSMHSSLENQSYVDLNRTGVPLIEIVSEPDIRSPEEAVAYLRGLRSILIYLGICEANMEEGNFRCDANVSLRPVGQDPFGTRTELKNMNSFRHVQKALEFEIRRQEDLLLDGQAVVQETRLFDETRGLTKSMRGKEEAHDYRYFPDPDLVSIKLAEDDIRQWEADLPELPRTKMERFQRQYSLPEYDAAILTAERDLADYFEETIKLGPSSPKTVSNWIMTDVLRELRDKNISLSGSGFGPSRFASLLKLIDSGKISPKTGKQIFPELFAKGLDPEEYVEEKGFVQISDDRELNRIVEEVLTENPNELKAYKEGKTKLMSFFMGQVMKKTKGQANPKLVTEKLKEVLK